MMSGMHLPTLGFIADSTRLAAGNMPALPRRELGHYLVRDRMYRVSVSFVPMFTCSDLLGTAGTS